MKILWLTWKDLQHPLAGGAERVNEELAQRLTADGHEVIFLVGGFANGEPQLERHGYQIIRVGNRWSVYWSAFRYYQQHLRGWADIVIDEINTIPFLAKLYVKEKNLLFIHMLCREIWFYELPWVVGWVGYLLEPWYLRLLNDRVVITVSNSTKQDLKRYNFAAKRIHIISEGLEWEPVKSLDTENKFSRFTILSLGSIRPMKRTLQQIKAFELARDHNPDLQLKIVGDASSSYGQQVLSAVQHSRHRPDIQYLGRVNRKQKLQLMRRSHLLLMTSVKEGWGLTVTEAASQGTPSAVYNVDGLRDSVQHGKTGLVTNQNTPAALAQAILELATDSATYAKYQRAGWSWSQEITFDTSYQQFLKVLNTV